MSEIAAGPPPSSPSTAKPIKKRPSKQQEQSFIEQQQPKEVSKPVSPSSPTHKRRIQESSTGADASSALMARAPSSPPTSKKAKKASIVDSEDEEVVQQEEAVATEMPAVEQEETETMKPRRRGWFSGWTTTPKEEAVAEEAPSDDTMELMAEEVEEEKSGMYWLVEFLKDADRTERTLDTLIDMELDSDEKILALQELSETKACDYLVEAMNRHAESSILQGKALQLMIKITFRIEKNRIALLKAGAPKAIYKCMKYFSENKDVQEGACGALRNLFCAEQKQITKVDDIIKCLTSAMERFDDHEELQQDACSAINHLTWSGDFLDNVLASNAIMVLTKVQNDYRDKNTEITKTCCIVLKRLNEHWLKRLRAHRC